MSTQEQRDACAVSGSTSRPPSRRSRPAPPGHGGGRRPAPFRSSCATRARWCGEQRQSGVGGSSHASRDRPYRRSVDLGQTQRLQSVRGTGKPALDALTVLRDLVPLVARRHQRSRLHALRDAVHFVVRKIVAARESGDSPRHRCIGQRSCDTDAGLATDPSITSVPPTSGEALPSRQSWLAPCRASSSSRRRPAPSSRETLAHFRSLSPWWVPHEAAKTSSERAP